MRSRRRRLFGLPRRFYVWSGVLLAIAAVVLLVVLLLMP
jgi:hypothetical protein